MTPEYHRVRLPSLADELDRLERRSHLGYEKHVRRLEQNVRETLPPEDTEAGEGRGSWKKRRADWLPL